MKAHEKDRTRRYETASDFIHDIRRHLANEPVEAGRAEQGLPLAEVCDASSSGCYCRAVIAGSLVALSLVAALLIATYGLVTARRDAAAARRQAEKAAVVTQLLDEMFQSATPGLSKGRDFTVRELLDNFSSRVSSQLSSEPEVEMTIRRTMGIAYDGLGEYLRAEAHLRRARDLAEQVFHTSSSEVLELDARLGWLSHELGDSAAAEELAKQVLAAEARSENGDAPLDDANSDEGLSGSGKSRRGREAFSEIDRLG